MKYFGGGSSGGGFVPTTRTINTTSPLTGGGNLSADLTLGINTVSNAVRGVVKAITVAAAVYLSNGGGTDADWTAMSGSGAPVGSGRTISTTAPLTGGGDLSANRTLAVNTVSNTSSGVVPAITAGSAALVSDAGGTSSSWVALAGGGSPVGSGRTISTTAPLTGGGDLSANRTLAVNTVSNTGSGVVPQTNGTAGQALIATSTGTTWSTDFQAQDPTTSGKFVTTNTTNALNIGTTVATAGLIRSQATTDWWARNTGNTANRKLFDWGVTGSTSFHVGDVATILVLNGTSAGQGILFRLNGSLVADLSTAGLNLDSQNLSWTSNISGPTIQQASNATNGATATVLQIRGQNAIGTTSTGGDVELYTGSGTSANGTGKLKEGGANAVKLSWNTTGLGLYGTAPVAQAARVGQLTDSTTGTPSTTIPDVGAAFSQATLNNIHASLLTKINSIETAIHNIGLTA